MIGAKHRVVIVDDSALSRAILKELLEAEGDIEVVGHASNGYDAVGVVDAFKPDVVTMDVDMPGPSGIETISWIMEKSPVPIIVVTGERLGEGSSLGFQAIERGAIDFTSKPSITDDASVERLRAQVRTLAKMKSLPRPGSHIEARAASASNATSDIVSTAPRKGVEIVGFASGIGGHRSLMGVLRRLPHDFPCAVAVVQHMAPRFAAAFARYLQQLTPLAVRVVGKSPRHIVPGELYICDAASHLICPERGMLATSDEPAVRGYRPSCTRMFETIAEVYGANAVGVIVSGSGDDGVGGLLRLKHAGALTIAETAETALPSDMPRAATSARAVERLLPAELIADFLVGTLTGRSAKTTAPPSELKGME